MHNQLFQLQQQLLQPKGGLDGYPLSGSGVSVPGSTSSYPDAPTDLAYVPPNTSSRALTINLPPAIRYRPILPSDLKVLKEIHEALFPIKYEAEFFMNVVQGQGIISWAAVDTNRSDVNREELVGFVTARAVTAPEAEESDMLGYEYGNTARSLIYILTLGVIRPYRNCGIASALVSEVVEYAASIASCRAVYLHVISYNKTAILFYEKNSFHALRKLRNFYYINGQYYDAYLYVFYVNGGRSPCTAIDFLAAVSALVQKLFSSVATRLFGRNTMGKWSQKHKDVCGPGSPTNHRLHGPDNTSANLFV